MEFYGYTTIVYTVVYFCWICAVCTLIAVIMSGILKIVNCKAKCAKTRVIKTIDKTLL